MNTESLKGQPKHTLATHIYHNLNDNFRTYGIGEFCENANRIEFHIEGLLQKTITDYLASCYKTFAEKGEGRFSIKGKVFETKITRKGNIPALDVWLLDVLDVEQRFREKEINVSGCGYITRIELSVNHLLKTRFSYLCDLAELVYKTAYQWLEETLWLKIAEMENESSCALYSYLKTVMSLEGKEGLADEIWFSVFSDKTGVYLLNRRTLERIASLLLERKYI